MNMNKRTAWVLLPCLLGLLTCNCSVLAQSSPPAQNGPDQDTEQPSEANSQSPDTTVEEQPTSTTAEKSAIEAESDSAPETTAQPEASDVENEATSKSEGKSQSEASSQSEATQGETEQTQASENRGRNRTQPQKISTSLPTSTAVVVTVCQPIRFDSKQKQPFPVTAVLSHPIADKSGNVIAPIRSLANLQIHPKRRMVEMQVNSVIVDGRLVPLQTTPVAIPVMSRLHPDSQNAFFDSGVSTEGIALNVVNNLQGWISEQGLISDGVSDILGVGLSVASGITSAANSPRKDKISELPRGVSLIFALANPVRMTKSQSTDVAEPAGTNPCSQVANGSSEYSDDSYSDDSYSDDGYSDDGYSDGSFGDNQY